MSTVAYAPERTVAGAPSTGRRRHTAPPAGPSPLPPPPPGPPLSRAWRCGSFLCEPGGGGGAGGAGSATLSSQRPPRPHLAPRGGRGAAAAAAPHHHGRLRQSKASPRCGASRVVLACRRGDPPRNAADGTPPPRVPWGAGRRSRGVLLTGRSIGIFTGHYRELACAALSRPPLHSPAVTWIQVHCPRGGRGSRCPLQVFYDIRTSGVGDLSPPTPAEAAAPRRAWWTPVGVRSHPGVSHAANRQGEGKSHRMSRKKTTGPRRQETKVST